MTLECVPPSGERDCDLDEAGTRLPQPLKARWREHAARRRGRDRPASRGAATREAGGGTRDARPSARFVTGPISRRLPSGRQRRA